MLTATAKEYIQSIISKDKSSVKTLNLRLNVDNPGTQQAEINLVLCPVGHEDSTDYKINYDNFNLYIEQDSLYILRDAMIDFMDDEFGGQLSVKAPYIKDQLTNKNSLKDKIQFVIDTEINPNLARHGGFVRLVEITHDKVLMLSFGGGCHGCSMVDITLKSGIEKILFKQCPEIKSIQDVTNHNDSKQQ